MRTLRYLLLLIIFFTACKSAEDYVREGNNEAKAGNFKEAIEKFEYAIQKNSKIKSAYAQEGYCYEDLKEYDHAIKSYQKLLLFYPGNTIALFSIGTCKDNQQKFPEAIEWYNKALKSKGFDVSDSANVQTILNFNKDGILSESDQVVFDVNSNEIFYNRGLAYYSSGQVKKAYLDFKDCIQNGYFVGSSYYMVGLCWLHVGKKDRACDAFGKGSFYGDSLSRIQLYANACK
jgi:tetratricopeptide (TPR) repeat protein